MIRNIIWDVDGTLFDTYPAFARAFQSALAELGKSAALNWIESLAKVSMDFAETSLAEHFQLDKEELDRKFDQYYGLIRFEDQPVFPGVKVVCETILSLGGKNVIVTHREKSGTDGLLAASRMAGYFAGALTHDDGYPRKPDPAAFEAALSKYALPRAETIAVGDRDIDILAGQAAGLRTCLFGAEIAGLRADLTIDDFQELQRYIMNGINAN